MLNPLDKELIDTVLAITEDVALDSMIRIDNELNRLTYGERVDKGKVDEIRLRIEEILEKNMDILPNTDIHRKLSLMASELKKVRDMDSLIKVSDMIHSFVSKTFKQQ